MVELRAGALGAHSLEEDESFTHASALVNPVFADKHVHGDLCRRVIENTLFVYAKSSQVNTLPKAKSKTRSKQNKDMHKFSKCT